MDRTVYILSMCVHVPVDVEEIENMWHTREAVGRRFFLSFVRPIDRNEDVAER